MADVETSGSRTGERSSWAVGWTYFASVMMILVGVFQGFAGLVAIFNDEFYVTTRNYVLQFDATQWGWIHLIVGVVILLAGFSVLSGSVFARTVGVVMAIVSALTGFAWLPYYPIWGILIVTIAISIIWALTAHGRDVTR